MLGTCLTRNDVLIILYSLHFSIFLFIPGSPRPRALHAPPPTSVPPRPQRVTSNRLCTKLSHLESIFTSSQKWRRKVGFGRDHIKRILQSFKTPLIIDRGRQKGGRRNVREGERTSVLAHFPASLTSPPFMCRQ